MIMDRSVTLRNFSRINYFRPVMAKLSDNMSANSTPLNNDDTLSPKEAYVVPAETGEWQTTNWQQIDTDEFEDDRVDQTFREQRHNYSSKPTVAADYLKQIKYRTGHIGTKELEIVFRDYLELFGGDMSYEQLEQFDKEILDFENPQLQRYLINGAPILEADKKNEYL